MENDDKPARKMTRCPDGHVFDAAEHASCPRCGWRAGAARKARPTDPPAGEKFDADAAGNNQAARQGLPKWALFAAGAAIIAFVALVSLRKPAAPDEGDVTVAQKETQETTSTPDREPDAKAAVTVERWRTTMIIGGQAFDCINETTSEGRYRLGDGCPPPFAGETGQTIVNADGSWTTRSDSGRVDSGTIEVVNDDKIIAHTRGGPVVWERVR